MRFQIRHLSGSKAGQEEILEGKVITIGRDPNSMLRFDPVQDDRVSTNHAQLLVQDNGQVLLTDLGSSNGTFIGEQKVSSAIPLMTGAMVRFGDEGPQVSITFLPPEAPKEEPAPPPKKSKAPLIIIAVVALLGLICVIAGAVALLSDDEPAAQEEGEEEPAEEPKAETPQEEPKAEPPQEEPKPEPPQEEPKPASDEVETPWAKVDVGTVFEQKSTTEMDIAGNKTTTELTLKYTLKEKTDTEAVVSMETIMANMPPNETEQRFPLKAKVTGEGESDQEVETKQETIEVPAGKYDCTYSKTTSSAGGQESVSEVWMSDDLPVPVKSVTTNPTMTSTTELVSVGKQ